jgi:hypothetical protein
MTDDASAAPPTAAPASAPPAARPGRGRRTLIILASISIGWKVIVFTLGAALPHWLIEDGIAELPAALQPYGEEAKQSALALWNGPIERHGLVRTVRVVSVERLADGSADARCNGLVARVRAYTYFAIPYSEVRMVCDRGVVEYRVFRRRHRPTG